MLRSQSLKMASSKPKHVAVFCQIVYAIKLCSTTIILLLIIEKYTTGMSHHKKKIEHFNLEVASTTCAIY